MFVKWQPDVATESNDAGAAARVGRKTMPQALLSCEKGGFEGLEMAGAGLRRLPVQSRRKWHQFSLKSEICRATAGEFDKR